MKTDQETALEVSRLLKMYIDCACFQVFEKMQRTHGLSMEAEKTQSEQAQQKLKNDIAALKEENEKKMEVMYLCFTPRPETYHKSIYS